MNSTGNRTGGMEMAKGKYRRWGTAPNQVCVCVDEIKDGEISGKVYSRYSRTPWEFNSLIELLGQMESFYNKISFPQAAVQIRGIQWQERGKFQAEAEQPFLEKEFLLEKRGIQATFLIIVRYRQNATWQGSFLWVEENRSLEFKSALELLMMMDKSLKTPAFGRNPLRKSW